MSSDDFIKDILNIKGVELELPNHVVLSDGSLEITVKVKELLHSCLYCKGNVKRHGFIMRKLIHSTFSQRRCTVIYMQRRYKCDYCGRTFSEINPFANSGDNITYETKIYILKELKNVKNTYASTAERVGVSKTKVINIFDKHVNILRKPLPEVLSLDEHYFPTSNYSSLYCLILMDFKSGTIVDILPDRKKGLLTDYLSNIKKLTFNYTTKRSELDNVKYVSIDLCSSYRDVAKVYFPRAVICADSFHVLKHLTDDFRRVFLRCRRNTDNPKNEFLLIKFRFVFNHNVNLDKESKYNRTLQRYASYRDIRDYLFGQFPVLQQAYELKEYYINFNSSCPPELVSESLDEAIALFADCEINEYREFYSLLRTWRNEIINSFSIIDERRINNSYIESKNRQIEDLIRNANGFQNFNRTRNRILYCLNKNENFTL